MTTRSVHLFDPTRTTVATAQVIEQGGLFGGTIDLCSTPPELRAIFEEFEEIVNGQMFVFLDDVQRRIAALRLRAMFEDGAEAPVTDLQVFPIAGEVSFRTVNSPSPPDRCTAPAGVTVPSASVELAPERN